MPVQAAAAGPRTLLPHGRQTAAVRPLAMSDVEPSVIPLFPEPPRRRPRVKKLRLLLLLIPVTALAVVSTVFGMMMAVASDLPALENDPQYRGQGPRNTLLQDVHGQPLGRLAGKTNQLYVQSDQIADTVKQAVISIEDRRFQTNSGVDVKGIARALTQDLVQKRAAQGGSTITQQFVKNALQAQDQRTVFQKLREAALAYHLTRKWSKSKILTEYLNSIYFGNGAYGIEAAAETYFSNDPNHEGCGTVKKPCVSELKPHEAALLGAIIASPSAYDPVAHPAAAKRRRDLVLRNMRDQGYIDAALYVRSVAEALPSPRQVSPPSVDSKAAPYFTTWVRQQLVDRYGARQAFQGGLTVRTTLDLQLQKAAQKAVDGQLPPGSKGPTASLVAIDNDTGEVRAMVSGTDDYSKVPFNLATQGQRQPGSSFKPFILAEALAKGYGPGSVWPSAKQRFCVQKSSGGKCREQFVVNNFEDTYVGQRTLSNALTYSDNSVFATVGIKLGTGRVARLAERMGIRTPISTNYAMTLGGLREGVTPLDMAHAYEAFPAGGRRISGTLGAPDRGPVGIREVKGLPGGRTEVNKVRSTRVLSKAVAEQASSIMSTVVSQGTGKRAAFGPFAAGKTGTTENYGDAWFVGFTDRMTVAVWVGYPNGNDSMDTDFAGQPVEGGTFPALVWHDFMVAATPILDKYAAADREAKGLPPTTTTPTTTAAVEPPTSGPVPSEGAAPAPEAPAATTPATATPKAATPATPAPETPDAPATPATPATPAPATPDAGGTGGAGDTGGAAPTG